MKDTDEQRDRDKKDTIGKERMQIERERERERKRQRQTDRQIEREEKAA